MVLDFTLKEINDYMLKCIDIAKRADEKIRRPYVGALILSPDGEVIGEGHKGMVENTSYIQHAERMVLSQGNGDLKGATLITTLEPCITTKKNQILSSCSDLIVETEISQVIFGRVDHHLRKFGNGSEYLRECGVDVQYFTYLYDFISKELM
jgi:diaminohydroxyphosphoribosylaminopyrimidine deaminase / 5-amino-6-(5-phosphoribosylamino)uracil reductase